MVKIKSLYCISFLHIGQTPILEYPKWVRVYFVSLQYFESLVVSPFFTNPPLLVVEVVPSVISHQFQVDVRH